MDHIQKTLKQCGCSSNNIYLNFVIFVNNFKLKFNIMNLERYAKNWANHAVTYIYSEMFMNQ